MAIKRYYASADNTITNAFQGDLKTRGTGANMGLSDILEVYSIYGQESSGSQELSRALIKFDLSGAANTINSDATAGKLKLSGKASCTFAGTTDLEDDDDSELIIRNADGTSVTFTTDSSKSISASTATLIGTSGADTTAKAAQAMHVAFTAAIAAGTLKMTLSPSSYTDETSIELTQKKRGSAGNTTVTIPDNITANGTEGDGSSVTTSAFTNGTNGANFYLRLFNAEHGQTLPKDAILVTQAVTGTWFEGNGLDMEGYTDLTNGAGGSNWVYRQDGDEGSRVAWERAGGRFIESPVYTASFGAGTSGVTGSGPTADLQINVTDLVYEWYDYDTAYGKKNHGFIVRLTGSQEAKFESGGSRAGTDHNGMINNVTGSTTSYYTKKFFARGTEFFYKRPCLEARWNDATKDDTGNAWFSSSLAPQAENLNTIYMYNYVRGQLRNIPDIGTGPIWVELYSGSIGNNSPSTSSVLLPQGGGVVAAGNTVITGGYVSTGIYSASFAITSSTSDYNPPSRLFSSNLTKVYAVWANCGGHSQTGRIEFLTSSFYPKKFDTPALNPATSYAPNITNLKSIYSKNEQARFRIYTRQKDWNPTIYTKASTETKTLIIDSGSYSVYRIIDELDVIPYGTGSLLHTQMSYDVSGNYFDLDMGIFEPGYAYAIKLAYYNGSIGSWVEQPETFKFRVE
jgi:hypothetical protein